MTIYTKSNTFSANTVIASANVNQNFDEISTAINSTLTNGTSVKPTVGGTGLTSYTTGDTLYASASNVLSKLTAGSAGQVLQVVGGIPAWATINAGAKNYVTYNNFEDGVSPPTGWSLGTATLTSNLPTGAPTFGSGASGNLTLSTVSSGKLAGSYSMSLASSAATTQGNFIASQAYTIDTEDQSKVLSFKFYYSPTVNASNGNWSGTTSNSFGVAIYDVTNSAWIIPAGVFNLVQSTGVGICQGTFQTPSNMTSFRLAIYNANATTNSITMLYDDFYVGPQSLSFGPAITDWASWTPTGSWSANTTYTGWYRRDGDSLSMIIKLALAGAPTSASLTVTLPNGYVIDTTKLPATPTNQVVGYVTGQGAAHTFSGVALYGSTTAVALDYTLDGNTASIMSYAAITQAAPYTFANADFIYAYIDNIPITGWSSNTLMSADTDSRVVFAKYYLSANNTPGSNTQINIDTKLVDTHGAVTTGAGAWKFTAPISGMYQITMTTQMSSSNADLVLYKNGVNYQYLGNITTVISSPSTMINLVAGDYIDFRASQNLTWVGSSTPYQTTVSINRIAGPAVVAASESVNARYYASATSVSGSLATINWTTKDYDTHGAMSAGTYTIPVTGKYEISAAVGMTGTYALNNLITTEIQKNGTVVARVKNYAGAAVTQLDSQISDTISCLAGDTLRVQVSNGCTSPVIVTSNFENYISLARVGN